jgi:hypothetical protein
MRVFSPLPGESDNWKLSGEGTDVKFLAGLILDKVSVEKQDLFTISGQ